MIITPPLPQFVADPVQVMQVFQNLIVNAIKFQTDGNMPRIVIKSSPAVLGSAPGVSISVSDNGIGFEQQHSERIFAPFQRLHGRSEYGGSGIGLAVVRRIVERHGGTISAVSSPGHGATFTFLLPIEQDPFETQPS